MIQAVNALIKDFTKISGTTGCPRPCCCWTQFSAAESSGPASHLLSLKYSFAWLGLVDEGTLAKPCKSLFMNLNKIVFCLIISKAFKVAWVFLFAACWLQKLAHWSSLKRIVPLQPWFPEERGWECGWASKRSIGGGLDFERHLEGRRMLVTQKLRDLFVASRGPEATSFYLDFE